MCAKTKKAEMEEEREGVSFYLSAIMGWYLERVYAVNRSTQ